MKTEMGLSKLNNARWVARLLTGDIPQRRMEACQRNLQLVNECAGNEELLSCFVISEEIWISNFEPETKQQSKVWTLKGSNPPIKTVRGTWKKIILTAFFDQKE